MPTTIGPFRPDPKGAYSGATEYRYLDWVTDSGNSYLYINDTPSTGTALSSGTHWLKIAEKGNQDIVDAAEAARDTAIAQAALAQGYAEQLAEEFTYASRLTTAESELERIEANSIKESETRAVLTKNKQKIRETPYSGYHLKRVLLMIQAEPILLQMACLTAVRSVLKRARIPYDEMAFDTLIPANASEYSLIIVPYPLATEIVNGPTGVFGGSVGVPVIAYGGGAGWDGRTTVTKSSGSTDGAHHYNLPGGYDYYTAKTNRYCNHTLSTLTGVENIIYDPLDAYVSHVWSVQGATNKTLWISSYDGYPLANVLLYYVKLWGDYKNALPLPLCYDLDDANISESPWTADPEGLANVYDYAKSLGILITAGIKTEYMTGPVPTRYPTAAASAQTAYLREHQDVYIPIVHDHHYGTWGNTNTLETLRAQHTERLAVARTYGFAIPRDMYGYLFEPNNEYNENAIAVWKEVGIVAARDSGSAYGVWSSDGTTPIPIADRYALTGEKILWINACQYTSFASASVSADMADKGYTLPEWCGLAINRTAMALWGGFPTAVHKSVLDTSYQTRASTVYFHGTNVSGDSPMLTGMQLFDGLRKAFPGTIVYSHPSALVNANELTYIADI